MISAGRVLLMPKGAYNPSTTYEILDIVSYNGSSYIAKGTTTGNLPTDTTYWQLSAYGGQASNMAGNFAELEVTSVASMTHYADDIFVDENSQLMRATQTINIGDTIDVNTNCTPTTVEALLILLSARMDSLDSVNRKIQGAIEIAAQTDLHSLALGEYYKSQTSFYVTNAPDGIDQVTSAKFRLTVEAGLADASQASSPLLLTLRTPDGKIYAQGFDGTIWGSWEQIAVKSSLDAVEASVADVETSSTASKTYAIGKSFYYDDVLYKATAPIPQGGTITPGTNCTPEKIIEKIDDLTAKNQTLTNEVDTIVNDLSAKNIFDIEKWLTAVGLSYTKNGDTYTTSTGGQSHGTPFAFADKDIDIVISGIITNVTANYVRIEVLNASNEVVAAIRENITSASGKGCKIRLNWTIGGNFSIEKPMIRPASITSNDYVPYAKTNQQLTEDTNAIEPMLNVLGAKNLLKNTASSATINGITFTVNSDGSVSVSGTATAEVTLRIDFAILPIGSYKMSGCPAGGSNETFSLKYYYRVNSWTSLTDIGSGTNINISATLNENYVGINIKNGTTISTPITFYPMIRPADIEDSTFVPYAMTNRELTEVKSYTIESSTYANAFNFRKIGKVVQVQLPAIKDDIPVASLVTVGDLPSDLIPLVNTQFQSEDPSTGSNAVRYNFTSQGVLTIYRYSGTVGTGTLMNVGGTGVYLTK